VAGQWATGKEFISTLKIIVNFIAISTIWQQISLFITQLVNLDCKLKNYSKFGWKLYIIFGQK